MDKVLDQFEEFDDSEDILRGLDEPKYRRRRRRANTGGYIAATLFTTPASISIPSTTAIGTTIGTVGISGGFGAYSLSLSDPSGLFVLVGNQIQVNSALSVGTYPITINGTNGLGDNPVLNTSIVVTSVAGYVPTYPFLGF